MPLSLSLMRLWDQSEKSRSSLDGAVSEACKSSAICGLDTHHVPAAFQAETPAMWCAGEEGCSAERWQRRKRANAAKRPAANSPIFFREDYTSGLPKGLPNRTRKLNWIVMPYDFCRGGPRMLSKVLFIRSRSVRLRRVTHSRISQRFMRFSSS